jgi:hypothetical protein
LSEASEALKHLHTKAGKTESKAKWHEITLAKHNIPKVFCPEFNGDNPMVWKSSVLTTSHWWI